jgi:arylsulfatase
MSKQPDIIFIITDQQRYDTIRALGASHMDTPNIDCLVANGFSFEQCHVTAPSCVPCRASLFTGYYPHTNGVLANGQPWSRTWVSDLANAGYHCVNVGKMHTIPYDAKAGFHERFVVENKDRYMEGRWFFDEWDKALASHGLKKQQREEYRKRDDYKDRLGAFTWDLPPAMQSDNFIGDTTCWWLETKPVEKPLFLVVGFPGPHPPYDPTPEVAEKYMARDVPMPDVSDEDLQALAAPWIAKREHDVEVDHDSVVWKLHPTEGELKRMRAYYYANCEMIDTQVGRIVASLEKRGNLDNTIIIFTSDHGDNLGDHGLSQKWAPYEEVTRVPLVISAPGRFEGGRRVSKMVQLFDLGPTILEWAGLKPDGAMEAISLNPALEGEAFAGRTHVFCEQAGDVNMTGATYLTMARSKTHKLVHFRGSDEGQLFDLMADPGERKNLWNEPSERETKQALLNAMLEFHIESSVQTRNARSMIVSPQGAEALQ